MRSGKTPPGFSLLEIILTILLLSILSVVSLQINTQTSDASRYEETRKKMETIRKAILGDEARDSKGQRLHFGYHGDMGHLPVTLNSLVSKGSQPAWAFNTFYNMGAGWRGPYYSDFFNSQSIELDAWGSPFVWQTVNAPPSLTSYGANKTAGTDSNVYSKDLVIDFPASLRLSSVRGFVLDGATRLTTARVEIAYPANGVIQTVPQALVNTSLGAFAFRTVPFGPAAVRVTSVPLIGNPSLGPKTVAIDSPNFFVANDALNFLGSKNRLTRTVGNIARTSATFVWFDVDSGYDFPHLGNRLKAITVHVDQPNAGQRPICLNRINFSPGGSQNIPAPYSCSGNRTVLTNGPYLYSNRTSTVSLYFRNQTGKPSPVDFSNRTLNILMEWSATPAKDALTIKLNASGVGV